MCDTFIALPHATASGKLIFAKNSDREPGEAQALVHIARKQWQTGEALKTTYLTIPQVAETYEVWLSKPFWMWGAEMGANEHGVVIGNEAVFTKVPFQKKNQGLTGMDMLRLALERCQTAQNALSTIIELLTTYGQDACGGYRDKNFYYHNAFMIADAQEAFVLETAGREWAMQRVNGVRSISNGLSIGEDYDQLSPQAIAFAQQKGWYKKGQPFHFAKCYADPLMAWASACKIRQNTTQAMASVQISVVEAMQILASHHTQEPAFAPHKASTKDVCMHATGLLCPNQTVGSMVIELSKNDLPSVWATGSSNPCISIFKPLYWGKKAISLPEPSANIDNSFWWTVEKLHRLATKNYGQISKAIHQAMAGLQTKWLQENLQLIDNKATTNDFKDFSQHTFQIHQTLAQQLYTQLHETKSNHFSPYYQYFWKRV